MRRKFLKLAFYNRPNVNNPCSWFITLLFGVVTPHKPEACFDSNVCICVFFRFVQAMRYLSYALYPLLLAGAVYSLVYHPHKRYSNNHNSVLNNNLQEHSLISLLSEISKTNEGLPKVKDLNECNNAS